MRPEPKVFYKGGRVYIAIAAVLIVASFIAHELGHLYAMRSSGIPVQRMGVGIPIPYLTVTIRSRHILSGLPITISPLLLGAYVQPTPRGQEMLEKAPYRTAAYVFGMGPWASIAFGILLMLAPGPFIGRSITRVSIVLAVGALGLLIFWLLRRMFCTFLVPFASVPLLALIIALAIHKPAEALVGPIGIAQFTATYSTSLLMAFVLVGIISLSIGITNMLPLVPFDGGRTVSAYLSQYLALRWRWVFDICGMVLAAALVIAAFASDFFRISG